MVYADGGADSNLVIGYSPIEDTELSYGFAVQFCQTFTIDIETVFHLFVPKFEVDTVPDLQHFILYNTDASGKPTGSPICDITKQFTQREFRDPTKWRRILFPDFPILAPGLYAMVLTVPWPHTINKPKWAARQTPDLYPDGKAWKSSNFGLTWSEIPNTSFLFEVWGWTPPPDPPPDPVISNWAPLALALSEELEGYTIVVTTDIPVHLYMRWTNVQPVTHAEELVRRGISLPNATRFCFVAWEENEQEEAGDTLVHTFIKPDWQICETRWFYFIGTKQAEESPSASPIFWKHRSALVTYDLVPNGDGGLIELQSSGEPHWQMVLYEDTTFYPPDDVYIYGHFEGNFIFKTWFPSVWETDLFTFTNLPAEIPDILKLTVSALARPTTFGVGWFHITLKTHGTIYYSEQYSFPLGDTWVSPSWLNNPHTDLPWTRDEVNALQAGITIHAGFAPGGYVMCDIIKMSVAFVEPS